jgi:predicted amidohydrolase
VADGPEAALNGAETALTPAQPPDSQRGSALVQVLRKIAEAWDH